jgi:putative redox protein
MRVELKRVDENYHFEGIGNSDVPIYIDGSREIGGNNSGARPMELILMGLATCGAMDIISILKKQKEVIKDLKIVVEGLRDYDQTPAVFTNIDIAFHFIGNLNDKKVRKALNLSMEKYCSVSAMLEGKVKINYSYKITKIS